VIKIIVRIIIALLMLAIFASAANLVWIRHQNLLLFIELQNLQKERDKLNVEWRKLQLEQSTWAQHNRIEKIAREQLRMFVPDIKDIIVIKKEDNTNRE